MIAEETRPRINYNAQRRYLELRFPPSIPHYTYRAKEIGAKYDTLGLCYTLPAYAMNLASLVDAYPNALLDSESIEVFEKQLVERTKSIWTPVEAFEFQKDAVRFLLTNPHPGSLLALSPGLGKGHPIGTNLLTPAGWIPIEQILPGDYVIGSNGKATRVTGVYPRGELPVFRVKFSDGASVETDADHLWQIQRPRSRVMRDYVMYNVSPEQVILSTSQMIETLEKRRSHNQMQIPNVQPVEFVSTADLPIDPYILGVLLGDGFMDYSQVSFSAKGELVATQVGAALQKSGTNVTLRGRDDGSRVTYSFIGNEHGKNAFIDGLRELDLYGKKASSKFIPSIYKFASVENRIAILQGLMDTDGEFRVDNHTEFGVVSKQLADDAAFLVESLGGTARRHTRIPHFTYKGEYKTGQVCYRLTISLPENIIPFRAKYYEPPKLKSNRGYTRFVTEIEPAGLKEVICISVEAEDRLYVTEHCIVTHNSLVALTAAENLAAANVLIVSPLSLLHVWEDESEKWLGRELIRCHREGPTEDAGWFVTNYETAVNRKVEFLARRWDVIIIDESIMVKSRSTQRFKALSLLRKRASLIWLLSGFPISRYADDLWAQLNLIDSSSFTSYWRFTKRYCTIEESPWGNQVAGTIPEREVAKDLRDVMFVVNQKDVLELPDYISQRITVDLKPDQRKAFDEMKKDFVASLETGDVDVSTKLTQLLRLQQITSNLNTLGGSDSSAKSDALMELIEANAVDYPMLVWVHWQPTAKALFDRLVKTKKKIGLIYGGNTGMHDHTFEQYKSGQLDILICSIDIGKYGHTLTNTRTVIYHDITWSGDSYAQSLSRVKRIGLKHAARLITLYASSSTDVMINANLEGKLPGMAAVSNSDLAELLKGIGR